MDDLFWRRWTQEYLLLLQERQKWIKVRKNFNIGDVVLVVDPSAPWGSWPLGRVLETKPDARGLIRSVIGRVLRLQHINAGLKKYWPI